MDYGGSTITTPSSLTLLADVMATKKVTLMERKEREQVTSVSKRGLVNTERKRLRSHCSIGFTTGGKVLTKLFRNLIVAGQVKTA